MSDHAVENNPRKELLFVGLFKLMLLGIVGLIFYGGYFRPAAPSVETLLAEAAAATEEAAATPVDASTTSTAEMVAVAAADANAPAPAETVTAAESTSENMTPDAASDTNADTTAESPIGIAVAEPATESRDTSTAAPVLGQ